MVRYVRNEISFFLGNRKACSKTEFLHTTNNLWQNKTHLFQPPNEWIQKAVKFFYLSIKVAAPEMNKLTLQHYKLYEAKCKGKWKQKSRKKERKITSTYKQLAGAGWTDKSMETIWKTSQVITKQYGVSKTEARTTWTLTNKFYVDETKCPFGVFNYSTVKLAQPFKLRP